MENRAERGRFAPGNKGGPGRKPVVLPEVQKAVDANRNAVKVVILKELEDTLVTWVRKIITQGSETGDVVRFKTLLELALGKMVDDVPEFPVNEEEKLLILEDRKRKLLGIIPDASSEQLPERTSTE